MNTQNDKQHLLQLTKETPKARKARVTSGVKLRATIFEDKKRCAQAKNKTTRQLLEEC